MKERARYDVTSIGEPLLRMSAQTGESLLTGGKFRVHVGGAEANVLTALSGLGRKTALHSRLPDSLLGRKVLRSLRAASVDTGGVALEPGGRMGLYFLEAGAGPITGSVIYDRADSSFSTLAASEVDWTNLLDTRVMHITGITPALGERSAEIVAEAVRRARAAGAMVSLDVNFRRKLWEPDIAMAALLPMLEDVDLIICGEQDARELFGTTGDADDVLIQLAEATKVRNVVLSLGDRGATARFGETHADARAIPVQVVDPIGAGDAFAAGIIDGWLDGDLVDGLRRGTILAAVKLSQAGDSVAIRRDDIPGPDDAVQSEPGASDVHR